MNRADKLIAEKNKIRSLVQVIEHMLRQVEDLGPTLQNKLDDFKKEINKAFNPLITEAMKPLKPRKAEEILEILAKEERLTPELLEEIKLAVEQENEDL